MDISCEHFEIPVKGAHFGRYFTQMCSYFFLGVINFAIYYEVVRFLWFKP